MSKVGFIGLGIMGKPMAHNLLKAGISIVVNDIAQEAVDELVAAGAESAGYSEIGRMCDVVITILPNGSIVQQVLFGEGGVAEGLSKGKLVCDMSSVTPGESKLCGRKLAEIGVGFIDAPVSGGEPGAIAGTLAIMCGGDEADFKRMEPFFSAMGSSRLLIGPIGSGSVTKLANQIIVAGNIAVLAEALTMVKKAGVDPLVVFEAIKGGLAGSTVMNAKAPMMIEGNFKPGFRVDLHIKDLGNALDTAHKVGAPVPITAMVQEMFETLHADGRGSDDHSSLANFYAKVSGTKIGK